MAQIEEINYSPERDGFQLPLFEEKFVIDDSFIPRGSIAVCAAKLGNMGVELFGNVVFQGTRSLDVVFYKTESNDPMETTVVTDFSFNLDDPDHVQGLLHQILSIRSRQGSYN